MNYPPKVQKEVDSGDFWRAKEILGNYVSQKPFSIGLCEQYGSVLLQTGDLVNAGKFLFISGSEKEPHQKAIKIYLTRSGQKDWKHLLLTFPRKARYVRISEYPEIVQAKLTELGMPSNYDNKPALSGNTTSANPTSGKLLAFVGISIAIFLLLALVLGIVEIISILWALVS